MKPKTLFDKIWDSHVVIHEKGYPAVLYIDAHLVHEVTSPQAFDGLRKRNIPVFNVGRTWATADHNVPTQDQHLPIKELLSRKQVHMLEHNCNEFKVQLFGLGHPWQGIVHVIGPELGITRPGMTIVCGDSHTSTHGAFGAIAFGIGTSEVEQVLATQTVIQTKPKTMNIVVNGKLKNGVTAKDIILFIISNLSTSGATGYFVEYSGETIRSLSMDGRMTICNMSVEMGARGGLIAPDETTYAYMKNKKFAPGGLEWKKALAYWKTLSTDTGATYDKTISFYADEIEPMVTYGTNPGMGIAISGSIPVGKYYKSDSEKNMLRKSLQYMGLNEGERLLGKKIDYIFFGSCTNARVEDFHLAAKLIKGRRKASHVSAYIVPGSQQVKKNIEKEGLDIIFKDAGFTIRQPGCSACLGMNEDKILAGKYCLTTSNRNFEGRQGPGARTMLASPLTVAASAIKGVITDPRTLLS